MKNNYRKIDLGAGSTIEDAIKKLAQANERGELCYGEFNGTELYSDTDDIDSAYKKITGKTKADFDAEVEASNQLYKEEERKHKEAIPELTKEWIEKGNSILDEKYHSTWAKCVPIRLGDLYRGMELGCTLDIVKELNDGCDLNAAKEVLDKQGHSGMSYSLVCSMVRSFCDRGVEFVSFVRYNN